MRRKASFLGWVSRCSWILSVAAQANTICSGDRAPWTSSSAPLRMLTLSGLRNRLLILCPCLYARDPNCHLHFMPPRRRLAHRRTESFLPRFTLSGPRQISHFQSPMVTIQCKREREHRYDEDLMWPPRGPEKEILLVKKQHKELLSQNNLDKDPVYPINGISMSSSAYPTYQKQHAMTLPFVLILALVQTTDPATKSDWMLRDNRENWLAYFCIIVILDYTRVRTQPYGCLPSNTEVMLNDAN